MKTAGTSGRDKELLLSAREGNEEAFKALFEKYWQDLFLIASKRIRSKEEARDIVQEVFLSLYKNIGAIQIKDSLGGYLYISLRNKIFNYYEKEAIRLRNLLNQPAQVTQTDEEAWGNLVTRELQSVIAEEINAMPERMRQIYRLSREELLSVGEITELLSLSPQTVKNQLHRALQRIRKMLRKQNLEGYQFLF